MCGACGGGGRAGRTWEDVAGRPDLAGWRARSRAVERLTAGSRWRVRSWHGSWLVTDPGGRQRHASSLWSLFALLPAISHGYVGAATCPSVRRVPVPPGWHVQAGLVWLAAASAGGTSARVTLPTGDGFTVQATLTGGDPPSATRESGDDHQIVITSRMPDELVGSLFRTGGGPLEAW